MRKCPDNNTFFFFFFVNMSIVDLPMTDWKSNWRPQHRSTHKVGPDVPKQANFLQAGN